MQHVINVFKNPENPKVGSGYKSGIEIIADSAVLVKKDIKDYVNSSVSIQYISEINKFNFELSNKISGGTTAAVPGVSVKGEVSSDVGYTHNTNSLYALVKIKKYLHVHSHNEFTKNDEAKKLLDEKNGLSFYSRFGDRAIKNVYYGGELLVALELQADEKKLKASLQGSGKVDSPLASAEVSSKFLLDNLSDTKISNLRVFQQGGKVDFNGASNMEELNKKIVEFMNDGTEIPIAYDTEPYTSLFGEEASITNIEKLIENHLKQILDRAAELRDQLEKVIDKNNIAFLNPEKIKLDNHNNLKLAKYQKLIEEKYLKKLIQIINDMKNGEKIIDDKKFDEYKKTLDDIESWYTKRQNKINEFTTHTLIQQIELAKDKKLKIYVPQEIKQQTKFLLLQLPNDKRVGFSIEKKGFFITTNVITDKAGKDIYIEPKVAKLSSLRLKVPKNLQSGIYLQVYAANEKLEKYNYQDVSEDVKEDLRKMECAVSAHGVDEDAKVQHKPAVSKIINDSTLYDEYEIEFINHAPEQSNNNKHAFYSKNHLSSADKLGKFDPVFAPSSQVSSSISENNVLPAAKQDSSEDYKQGYSNSV